MPGSNNGAPTNAERLNKTLKSRWNKRVPNVARALRNNKPALTRTNGRRNLYSNDRRRAHKLLVDLFGQGFEDRERILNTAKYQYSYNDHMLNMLAGELDRVGVYE